MIWSNGFTGESVQCPITSLEIQTGAQMRRFFFFYFRGTVLLKQFKQGRDSCQNALVLIQAD
jgi:hypothetical protein